MTEDQKKYYAAMKKMGKKKPVKAIPRPRVSPQSLTDFNSECYSKLPVYISVETTSDRVWNRYKQEVRHDNHDFHRPQHVDHDPGSLWPV